MKDIIIKRSISKLQREGLRFSIDEVAKSLKISKKTIYKFFSKKEELAVAIYKTFYEDAINQIELIKNSHSQTGTAAQMLTVYFQSHCMVREDIFNKYSLNDNIRILAQESHNKIRACIEKELPQADKEMAMIIIDGSLQRLCETKEHEKEVINKLVELAVEKDG